MDPLGETKLGRESDYDRRFIVALADVSAGEPRSAESASGIQADGIVVVAFEDYDSVLAPSVSLSRKLGRLAMIALSILLLVATGMWFLATRMFRETRRGFVGTSAGGSTGTFSSGSVPSTATGFSAETIDTSGKTGQG